MLFVPWHTLHSDLNRDNENKLQFFLIYSTTCGHAMRESFDVGIHTSFTTKCLHSHFQTQLQYFSPSSQEY